MKILKLMMCVATIVASVLLTDDAVGAPRKKSTHIKNKNFSTSSPKSKIPHSSESKIPHSSESKIPHSSESKIPHSSESKIPQVPSPKDTKSHERSIKQNRAPVVDILELPQVSNIRSIDTLSNRDSEQPEAILRGVNQPAVGVRTGNHVGTNRQPVTAAPVLQNQQENFSTTAAPRRVILVAPANHQLVNYRNDFFEQVNIVRQNTDIIQFTIDQRVNSVLEKNIIDNKHMWLNTGYVNHKQAVIRTLGYDADAFFITGGLDYTFSSTSNYMNNCVIGLTAAYTNTSADFKGSATAKGNKIQHDTFLIGPYIGYDLHRFNIVGSFLYGYTKYGVSRSLTANDTLSGGFIKAQKSSFHGDSIHGKMIASYTIPCKQITIRPIGGLTYDYIAQKAHQIKSDNYYLLHHKQSTEILQLIGGIKIDTQLFIRKYKVTPYMFGGLTRDIHNHNNAKKIIQTSTGKEFAQIFNKGSKDSVLTSAGITVSYSDSFDIDLSYYGCFSGHNKSNAVLTGLNFKF